MFIAKSGEYEAAGIYTYQHFILIAATALAIIVALKYTIKNKKDVYQIIKNCTIFVCIFEIVIITFKIKNYGIKNVNNYLPLYYCSLLIYAGLLSSFGKEKIKRTGDVFLATGAIIGGTLFMIYPSTSLPAYPMFHLVSLYSFVFHGIMVYLGILVNITNYVKLESKDIIYYASLVGIICIAAYFVNEKFDSNLMFISKNFPGTILEVLYKITGKYFTIIMIMAQMIIPFYLSYGLKKLFERRKIDVKTI